MQVVLLGGLSGWYGFLSGWRRSYSLTTTCLRPAGGEREF